MRADYIVRILALAVFLCFSSAAHATAWCEVAGAPVSGAAMRQAPAPKSKTVRLIKHGEMVSLLENDAEKRPKGWSRIAHSAKQESVWGSGERGWIETRFLKDCG
ncbi:MAG: hypothetical protein AB7F96_07905 [Beijerinckiaceae bacterium]